VTVKTVVNKANRHKLVTYDGLTLIYEYFDLVDLVVFCSDIVLMGINMKIWRE
jgi:hypothetical protein